MKKNPTSQRMASALIMTAFLAALFMLISTYGPGSRTPVASAGKIALMAPAHETETREPEETETHHPESTETHHPEATETEVEATQTHHPEATRTHEVEPTQTSVPEGTETAEPEATETHHPEATETHEVEPTETHEVEPTETHHPEATRTHEVEPTETSVPEGTETAEPEATETHVVEPTETNEPERTHTPEATRTSEPSPEPTGDVSAAPASLPGTASRTFPQTGKTVNGVFLQYWDSNGGLPQQGFPISGVMQEKSDLNGKVYTVQYFERAVFEYHPENKAPFNVLLSQLGTFRYKAKYPNGAGSAAPSSQAANKTNARYFPETSHTVGGVFLQYWQQNGGLAQQGFPISEEFTEVSPLDGKPYTVQYFERAVFEYHPENKAPFNVLLSQLGTFQFKGKDSGR